MSIDTKKPTVAEQHRNFSYKYVNGLWEQIDAQAAEIAEAKGQIEHLDWQNNALRDALGDLIRGYVNMMENGRDRIVFLGGDCDSVDAMEASDPWLKAARAALEQHKGTSQC